MSKITKSNTKEEILTALDKAEEEHGVLHIEIETLQKKVEDLETLSTEKNDAILDLESQVQEEDVKKQGLIKELAAQSTVIELAKKKTEKYGEIKKSLESTTKELEMVKGKLLAAEKKIDLLKKEVTQFEEAATKPSKRGFFKKFALCVGAVIVGFILFVSVPYFNVAKESISIGNPLTGLMDFSDNSGIIVAAHSDNNNPVHYNSVAGWANKAVYDGILYGKLISWNGKVFLEGNTAGTAGTKIDMNLVIDKLKKLGCDNVIAMVDNPSNVILPFPFTFTSKGSLETYDSRRKVASYIPVYWGEERNQINIKSDNVYGTITQDTVKMKAGEFKLSMVLPVVDSNHR